jgi:hypothetical protein
MAEAFTVFEKFGDVCAELEESDRKELIYAINMYGMFGVEVELPYMLKALFISLKEDIDNSKAMRARGSKGGRPKGKPRVSESEKPEVSEDDEPVVSESCEPMVSDDSENSESQSNPNQSKPNQSKPKVRRFTPPSVDEVREYCSEKGYTFDPEAFVAFYESKGWKVGRNPMKSWQAACTTWQKRQGERMEASHDEYSNL